MLQIEFSLFSHLKILQKYKLKILVKSGKKVLRF